MIPAEVVAAYGWGDAEIAPLAGGLINTTYAVRLGGAPIGVLQRLHKIFDETVNDDLDAVTTHLAAKGLTTPRLIRTVGGAVSVGPWRALTWIDGITVHRIPDPRWAEAGGELVGRFHVAVADLHHAYRFTRVGVHDTAAHLARLRGAIEHADAEAQELGRDVLAASAALPPLPAGPLRHCHGDLKISNLLFSSEPRGIALVDLDTLALGTMAFELGDAMRSWCNPRGEDAGSVAFELPIFAAAMRGFRAVADAIVTADERRAVVIGLETVCLELAARFAVDVVTDDYFGWDPARFPSRRAHNLVRARGQLALGLLVRAARQDALDIVHAADLAVGRT